MLRQRIDIDEYWRCAHQTNDLSGRNKGEGNGDDFVAGANIEASMGR